MSAHPSLSAPPTPQDPLRPKVTMKRFEPCWCLSGKKYKRCHQEREAQAPINIFEVEEQLRAELLSGYCSHPEASEYACSGTIIAAHTVQKKGGLSAIAEDGHVMTVKPTMKGMMESGGKPAPRRIGVNKASVFPGFCGRHDHALFKPVEGKSVALDRETAFLFAYRAIAYERFSKEAQRRGIPIQREMDRGCPFSLQVVIQQQLHLLSTGIETGLRDVDGWRAKFDNALVSGDRTDFHFLALRFDRTLPVVACGAFHAEYDLRGNQLQRLGRGGVEFEHVAVTVTAFEGRTVALLGWIGAAAGPAAALADSLATIGDSEKADALLRLLFAQTENLFMRPGWWDGMPPGDKDRLKTLAWAGTTVQARVGDDLSDDGRSLLTAGVVETVRG